jgi:hypothetical protein
MSVTTVDHWPGVAIDRRLADLFEHGMLMFTRLSARADARHSAALWYAWGRQDAGDRATRDRRAGWEIATDFAFAAFAACEAEAFERQYVCSLAPIHSQYARFVGALS